MKSLRDLSHQLIESENEKKEGRIEEEKEELCKVIHVSTQPFYQANPTIKEYEDKVSFLKNKNSSLI